MSDSALNTYDLMTYVRDWFGPTVGGGASTGGNEHRRGDDLVNPVDVDHHVLEPGVRHPARDSSPLR